MKKLLFFLFIIPLCVCGQDEYTIVGWSQDGLVAYTLFYSNGDAPVGPADYYEDYTLIIQDLRTDKILDSYSILSVDLNLTELLFNKYGIVMDTSNTLYRGTNFIRDNDISIISIEKDYALEIYMDFFHDIYETCSYPELNGYILNVTTHVFIRIYGDKKHIGSIEGIECYSGFDFNGYYKSPFEKRIFLVFSSTESEEGFMSDTKFRFIGCSLDPSTFK